MVTNYLLKVTNSITMKTDDNFKFLPEYFNGFNEKNLYSIA